MLKSILTSLNLFPDAAEGGTGGNVVVPPVSTPAPATPSGGQAPYSIDGQIPDRMKGVTIDMEGIESDLPSYPAKTGDEAHNKTGEPDKIVKAEPEVKPAPTEKKTGLQDIKPPVKAGDVKPEVTLVVPEQVVAKPLAKGARDYSKFDAADVPFLKAIPNEAFAHLEKRLPQLMAEAQKVPQLQAKLDEIAKNPNAIPEQWYNHQDAYKLHPEYQQSETMFNRAAFEYNHFKEQLTNIKSGQPYYPLRGYNPQTGQPVFDTPVEPDADTGKHKASADIEYQNYMNASMQTAQGWQQNINNFKSTFGNRYQASVKFVNDVIDMKCPWHKDEKDPRHKDAKDFDEAVPVEFRNHPSHKAARFLWATIVEFAKANESLVAQLKTGKTLQEITKEVEPTVSSVPTTDDGNGVSKTKFSGVPKTFDLAGMTD